MLPEPITEQKLHSNCLKDCIRRHIVDSDGWIGFDEYMEHALYTTRLGYYDTAWPKFGAQGDFVTAPLMGNVTAHCLAIQCAEVLAEIGHGDVIEFGAGSGDLAADLLFAMDAIGRLPERYLILETSSTLRTQQRQTIARLDPSLSARVSWREQMPSTKVDGVVLANELLDAMPAMRFEVDAHRRARMLGVAATGDRLHWSISDELLADHLQKRLEPNILTAGYRSEIGLAAEAWVRTVCEKINTGVMLLIDYGFPRHEFYHAQRQQGTLMCHYRHHAHDDPFFYPGLQDISVHVDFTALAEAAISVGMTLAGYVSQGAFLLSLGALDRLVASQTCATDAQQSLALSQQIRKLTLPHEMGELFKAIAFCRNYSKPLSGFSMHDRCARL